MSHRFGVRENMRDRVDRKVLRRFGLVERMSGEQLTKRVLESEVEERKDKGRTCRR